MAFSTNFETEQDSLRDISFSEQAYVEACELVGPNAPEFDSLVDKIMQRMWDAHFASEPRST